MNRVRSSSTFPQLAARLRSLRCDGRGKGNGSFRRRVVLVVLSASSLRPDPSARHVPKDLRPTEVVDIGSLRDYSELLFEANKVMKLVKQLGVSFGL